MSLYTKAVINGMSINVLNEDEIYEFFGQIVDVFEDLCTRKKISIENEERDADGSSESAIIWGKDYDSLADEVRFCLLINATVNRKTYLTGDEVSDLISNLISNFNVILWDRGSVDSLSLEDVNTISAQLTELFIIWEVLPKKGAA